MKELKVLVWDLGINIKNSGGPAGYLYNWKSYLSESKKCKNIVFLKDLLGIKNNTTTSHSKYKKWLDLVDKIDFLHIWTRINLLRYYFNSMKEINIELFRNININDYDVIHFHVSLQLYCALDVLKEYKGKILLTSHSPEPLAIEMVAPLSSSISILKRIMLHKYTCAELAAWNRADYMMFPVESATEPYRLYPKYEELLKKNNHKLVYCPTSILNSNSYSLHGNSNFFKELGIPDDAFVVSYIGRHNEIKGYDELVRLGKYLLPKIKNLYFVIGGYCKPDQGIQHPRWIELGWINNANEIMLLSNLFVLPNKQTYFDIVALEVIRSGTPLMMTLTGGNKFFTNIELNDGLFFYEYGDIMMQESIIKNLMSTPSCEISKIRQHNIDLYNSMFTMESFFNRYLKLIQTLV